MTGQGTARSAPAQPAATAPTVPCFYRVASRREDTSDTVTLELTEPAQPSHLIPAFAPGQFAMLTAFGVGEVPISVSSLGDNAGGRTRRLEHTLRAVGAVTRAPHAAQPGSLIGVRGPFGSSWDVASAAGRDIVIVAGGIGLAPLRPVVLTALADRFAAKRIPVHRIRVSLERNMRCGVGCCGHCQLGPLLVCRDGPVVGYDRAAALMRVREL